MVFLFLCVGKWLTISRSELFESIKGKQSSLTNNETHIKLVETLKNKLEICSGHMDKEINQIAKHFLKSFKHRWKQCYRNRNLFMIKNRDWLKTDIVIESTGSSEVNRTGRPSKDFDESVKEVN